MAILAALFLFLGLGIHGDHTDAKEFAKLNARPEQCQSFEQYEANKSECDAWEVAHADMDN